MGIMSAIGGIAARNPLVTALSGGGLIPALLASRQKGTAAPTVKPSTTGQNYTPYMGPGMGQGDTSKSQNPYTQGSFIT